MRAIGIILAGGNNNRMRELSDKRAIAAMPVAGSYRSIDFALSNMANSHVQKVAVLTQYNARSLNEHLSSSKWWDFGRKQGGLFVFTPTITKNNSLWYQGTADAIYQNIDFLKKSHEPYAIIASGDCVYKMDYNKVLEYHIAKRADITVVCTRPDRSDACIWHARKAVFPACAAAALQSLAQRQTLAVCVFRRPRRPRRAAAPRLSEAGACAPLFFAGRVRISGADCICSLL